MLSAAAMDRRFNRTRAEWVRRRNAPLQSEAPPSSSLVGLLERMTGVEIDSLERVNALLGQVQAEELDRETAPEEEAP